MSPPEPFYPQQECKLPLSSTYSETTSEDERPPPVPAGTVEVSKSTQKRKRKRMRRNSTSERHLVDKSSRRSDDDGVPAAAAMMVRNSLRKLGYQQQLDGFKMVVETLQQIHRKYVDSADKV